MDGKTRRDQRPRAENHLDFNQILEVDVEGKKYFVHPSVLNTVPHFKSQLDGSFGDGQVRLLLPEGCAIEAFDVLLQRLYCSGSCSLAKWLSIAVHGMSEAMSGTVEPVPRMSDVLQLSQMLLLDDISLELLDALRFLANTEEKATWLADQAHFFPDSESATGSANLSLEHLMNAIPPASLHDAAVLSLKQLSAVVLRNAAMKLLDAPTCVQMSTIKKNADTLCAALAKVRLQSVRLECSYFGLQSTLFEHTAFGKRYVDSHGFTWLWSLLGRHVLPMPSMFGNVRDA